MRNADLLSQVPLFGSLRAADCDSLASRLKSRIFTAGSTIFKKGDPGASMYIVMAGAIDIVLPGESPGAPPVSVKKLVAGQYFGELALFDDKPRSASAVALTDTHAMELTRDDLTKAMAESPTAAMTVLREMADRLRETNTLLTQRVARDAVKEVEENLTWSERFAEKIAELNGSWSYIVGLLALTTVWALLNNVPLPHVHAFDPFPHEFYNLFLGVLATVQGPLIVMTQNRQSLKDRAQADTDFRVNLKNEVGIERIQAELGAHRAETAQRLETIEKRVRAEVLASCMKEALGRAS